ncbi:EsaB/YukD family protein [Actinacidiphila reveromycinica]|uniref:EsaB/YukD family protein n=1 Tax=Actinacidiphila reveromycinica TaxID=659352 RepID=UPI00192387B2|nr:EsaB/YukD family protein [Streptomyces sp. SN-593]
MDEHCRITVVGERRQVDLAVPAGAPITTYVNSLAGMCGQPQTDVMPSAWSLALTAHEPFAPERSLAESGVVDGQVLYLCDVTAHEFDEPVVHDVAERVAEVATGVLEHGWSARARVLTVAVVGVLWLLATVTVSLFCGRMAYGVVADVAVSAGLVLPALAWVAGERRWPLPWRLRETLALSAVPLLAFAVRAMAVAAWPAKGDGPGGALSRAGFTLDALAVGALLGALLAYVAAFGILTCTVLGAAAVAASVGTLVALTGGGGTELAAVTAACVFVLLTWTVQAAGGLVGYVFRRDSVRLPESEGTDEDRVALAVASARTLLVAWTVFLSAVEATALVALAVSGSRYGVMLAACLGVALVLRAGGGRLTAEVVPVGVAGAAGLCTVLLLGAGHLGWTGWTAPGAACLVAVGLLGYGFRNLMRGSGVLERTRAGWVTSLASVLGGAGIALAVATFGVFGWVLEFGQRL